MRIIFEASNVKRGRARIELDPWDEPTIATKDDDVKYVEFNRASFEIAVRAILGIDSE
jgi:hypothetical protein